MYEKELREIDDVIAKGPYRDDWESLQHYKTPDWFRDAKFGIFIHWGVFAVPQWGSEWYPRFMYMQSEDYYRHHVETYGPHKEFGYKDFIPMFEAKEFRPDEWMKLFCEAGARYVVPVAEHHDGFQMYDSRLSRWNAKEMGPHRDVVGELVEAGKERGLVMGTSSHRMEHWFFFGHGREFDSDVPDHSNREDLYWPAMELVEDNYFDPASEPAPSKEFLEDWLVRICEVIDRFHPKVLYFDWWIGHIAARPYVKKMAAYYYNRAAEWQEEVALVYKYDTFPFGAAVYDIERGQMNGPQPYYWQTDTSTALNSWCYTRNNQFRTPQSLVQTLVDVVAKNGNLLLNVGPKSDGTICDEEQEILRGIGQWLSVNGEAIYGSRPWRVFGEGPTQIAEGGFSESAEAGFTCLDIRYTVKGNHLYATALAPAEDGIYHMKELGHAYTDAKAESKFHGWMDRLEVLTSEGAKELPWEADVDGLSVHYQQQDGDAYPVVFRITLR